MKDKFYNCMLAIQVLLFVLSTVTGFAALLMGELVVLLPCVVCVFVAVNNYILIAEVANEKWRRGKDLGGKELWNTRLY